MPILAEGLGRGSQQPRNDASSPPRRVHSSEAHWLCRKAGGTGGIPCHPPEMTRYTWSDSISLPTQPCEVGNRVGNAGREQ